MITKQKIIAAVNKKRDQLGSWVEVLSKLNREYTRKPDKMFYPEIFSKVIKGEQFYTFEQLQRIQQELNIIIFV